MTELTKQNIYDWLGSDNTEAQAVEIIQDLANGNYDIEALKSDILEYQDNEDLNTYLCWVQHVVMVMLVRS